MLSPPAVTAVFFLAQVYLAFQSPERTSSIVGAAAAEGPLAGTVQVRVVAEIHAARPGPGANEIPDNEAEFWELVRRDGEVMFYSDEVEVLTTPAQRFQVEEVGVITVEGVQDQAPAESDAQRAPGASQRRQ